jgi:hypothetical protein
MVLMNWDEATWVVNELPGSPATGQITFSLDKLCHYEVSLIAFMLCGIKVSFDHSVS